MHLELLLAGSVDPGELLRHLILSQAGFQLPLLHIEFDGCQRSTHCSLWLLAAKVELHHMPMPQFLPSHHMCIPHFSN